MTWLQTGSNRAFDLLKPEPAQVDFDIDIAEALARIPRYNGHVRGGPYSVAQHCVVGADIVFRDTRDREAAAAFLLHDAHEAYIGDIATPVAKALAVAAAQAGRDLEIPPSAVRNGIKMLKAGLDVAICRAAGMPGILGEYAYTVADYDLRMLATERVHLLGQTPQPWGDAVEAAVPLRLPYSLTVWPWPKAADEFRAALRRYLPERFGPAPRRPKSGPRRDGARSTRNLQEA
ncbi:MAG: hypothetical protein DI537_08595 [Stutzerimonas stutzeri]|nr:MAG: hypothetical protein DI537_08595 [Stutzerimonas stutzeri]